MSVNANRFARLVEGARHYAASHTPGPVDAIRAFLAAWGEVYDNEDEINGGDLVESLGQFIPLFRAAIGDTSTTYTPTGSVLTRIRP